MLYKIKNIIDELKANGELKSFDMNVEYKNKIDINAPDGALSTDDMMHSIFGPAKDEMSLRQQRTQFFMDAIYGSTSSDDIIDEITLIVNNKPEYIKNDIYSTFIGNIYIKNSIGYGLPTLNVRVASDNFDSNKGDFFREDNNKLLLDELNKRKQQITETRSHLEDIADFYDKIEQRNDELIKRIAINDYDVFNNKLDFGFNLEYSFGFYTFKLYSHNFVLIEQDHEVRLAVEHVITKLDLYKNSIDTVIKILKDYKEELYV